MEVVRQGWSGARECVGCRMEREVEWDLGGSSSMSHAGKFEERTRQHLSIPPCRPTPHHCMAQLQRRRLTQPNTRTSTNWQLCPQPMRRSSSLPALTSTSGSRATSLQQRQRQRQQRAKWAQQNQAGRQAGGGAGGAGRT